jgi:uncharacterized protein with von Willebrand factor type A (vWA) domain
MGLCYNTSKWTDKVWAGHLKHSALAHSIVNEGVVKQDQFRAFAQDIHARLYLVNDPQKLEGGPDWAEKLHETASDLKEWHQLKSRCKHSGFASGVATEAILKVLLDQIPQQERDEDEEELPYDPRGGQPGKGDGKPTSWTDKGEGNDSDLRRKLRRAIKEAKEQVIEAESSMDGLDEPLGIKRPGTQIGEQVTYKDLEHIRAAHKVVETSWTLKQIAELAGRLTRSADTHKKVKVDGSIGAVKGVELSGDIPRILPGELVGLRGTELERLLTLDKIVCKRALSYRMEAEQSETRGPIIVLEDLSGSMRGPRDLWAKAVALSILTTATRQKRDWTFIGFDYSIRHEDRINAGEADIHKITNALRHAPRGGTHFDPPFRRSVEIIKTSECMNKADIILITDGEADLTDEVIEQVKDLTENEGLQVYVIAIGAEYISETDLTKVATKVAYLATTNNSDPIVYEAINLEAA